MTPKNRKKIGKKEELDTLSALRTFARNFFNFDFFLKLLPLSDDELVMSEM